MNLYIYINTMLSIIPYPLQYYLVLFTVCTNIMYLDRVGKLSAHLEQFLLEFPASA